MKEEILTLAQAADRLGVSQRTVMRLLEKDDLKGFRIGNRWRFTQTEIDSYIDRQQKKGGRKGEDTEPGMKSVSKDAA